MKIHIITAWVLGEKVTLFHRPASQRMVDTWMEDNAKRLRDKGFSAFEVDSYYEDY